MMTIGSKFGQHEPLTTRLHNLVRSYPKGLGIIKEFIQNADDAEADEIVFVIDEQHHHTSGLPDNMKWLHETPALLVFNNKPFSNQDIEGIQKIGESGKWVSVGKTGRFGLGFNACYNITDVPYFFTNGVLYFFDPHYKSVQGATLERPGHRFSAEELVKGEWPLLDAFSLFINETEEFNGTVFRLPFRSDQQPFASKIKQESYTITDALDAIHELHSMGAAMLLFLKNVRHIKVDHRKEDGSVSNILHIQTENAKEVNESKLKVNKLLSSSNSEVILNEVIADRNVYSSCLQKYVIYANGKKHTEKWFVVDGFFIDSEQRVIDVCRRMISYEEKALPYAGAAWNLDINKIPKGRLFCFLPVPIQTSIPIQLNGYFDLDDSRQNMFLDSSAHGVAKLRVEWNKTLLETSVVGAYIKLLENLASTIKPNCLDSYYKAFPNHVNDKTDWENWLSSSFYRISSSFPLFRCSGDTSWCSLETTRSLPSDLLNLGDKLNNEDFLPIPNPPIPRYVKNGYKSNDINVPELLPNELRTQLKVNYDVNCSVKNAPRTCLQKRKYIGQIFRFCLSDNPGKDIKGLPLAIDFQNNLRTIGETETPLFLSMHDLDTEVFPDHPDWFVDPEFVKNMGLVESEDAELIQMDALQFVNVLKEYVSNQEDQGKTRLSKSRSGPLSDIWIQKVFTRLLDSEINKLRSTIEEIPLIPNQERILHKMGSPSTPLLIGRENDLRKVLLELSVPIVQGVSQELIKLLNRFASENDDYIWYVTPIDLIDTLEEKCRHILAEYSAVTDTHRLLLNYLSKEQNLTALKNETARRKTLKSLNIFPTVNGSLVDLNKTAYIPQDFTFPSIELDYILLDDGHRHQWRELYLLLSIPELSRPRLMREVLLPSFKLFEGKEHIEALSWIRDNLSIAQSEEENDNELFEEVRNTPLIICENGALESPNCVYQPKSSFVRAILGNTASFPDMEDSYAVNSHRWLEFFRQLNMPDEPRLSDVLEYTLALTKEETTDEKTLSLKAVFEFLKDRVDAELQSHGEISDDLSSILEELKEIEWIPLRKNSGDFICFSQPETDYARPCQTYFPRLGQLISSQGYVADLKKEPNKDARKAMGFPVNAPQDLVVEHFQKLLDSYSTGETQPEEKILVRALGQIYRFFGGVTPNETDEIVEDNEVQDIDPILDLKEVFSEVPCIWDRERKRFWRPNHVFSESVRYMEPWRCSIRASEDAIERGYEALGRKYEPDVEDWKQVLIEISDCGKSFLQEDVANAISDVVRHIVYEFAYENEIDSEVLVPTSDGRMLKAKDVFLADAPWYESILKRRDVPILSSSISGIQGIERVLKIPSLATSVEQRLIEDPIDGTSEDCYQESVRLEELLKSTEFIKGLQRMLRNEGHDVSEAALSFVKEIHVRCVQELKTSLYLQIDGSERFLEDYQAEFYMDHESFQVMLTEQRQRYFCDDLSGLLVRSLQEATLQNLAPLVHVLGCGPHEIETVLDELKVRKFIIEPDERNAVEDEVVPQDFSDETYQTTEQQDSEDFQETDLLSQSPDKIQNGENEDEITRITDDTTEEFDPSEQPIQESTASPVDKSSSIEPVHRNGTRLSEAKLDRQKTKGNRAIVPSLDSKSGIDKNDNPVDFDSQTVSTASHAPRGGQRRLVSYVSPDAENDDKGETTEDAKSRRQRISEAAVSIVLRHEKNMGRKAEEKDHFNIGYDVFSESKDETRYIEVKGTEGAWGERGVAMTSAQFFFARENPEIDHWLYVVEDVFSQTPQLHEIQNPSKYVDRFVFDGGWRQIADSNEGPAIKIAVPNPGDLVSVDSQVVGTVELVRDSGRFPIVIYRDKNGKKVIKQLKDITFHPKEK